MGAPRFREGEPVGPLARTFEEWRTALAELGHRPYRAQQVFRWIHADGVLDPAQMTNLPQALRDSLEQLGPLRPAEIVHVHRAADATRKLLLRMRDGATIETVLIPMTRGGAPVDQADAAAVDDEDDAPIPAPGRVRVTQCISTQVGCAMRCAFCASGEPGLQRHLEPDEIVAQVLLGRASLQPDEVLSNVVVMGMGEPLHNFDATTRAVHLLADPKGIDLSTRRITISTVGLVPEIERLGEAFEGRIGLAISLHAADDETRSSIIPANRRYPLDALMRALRAYPLPPRRRITIEYALMEGVNDGVDDAKRLVRLLRGLRVKVNLIPLNPVAHSDLRPPPMDRVLAFQRVLADAHYTCLIRRRRGDDISAACGQLAGS